MEPFLPPPTSDQGDKLAASSASTAPYEPKLGSHIPALDGVRGLAIFVVTIFRFNQGPEDTALLGGAIYKLFTLGERGVDLFFVLSGFLITGILYDAKHASHYFRNFYIRRTLRIFPLYYGVLFIAFFLLPWIYPPAAAIYSGSAEYQAWLWLYGANFLFARHQLWFLDGFIHFWSLAVEEHFYLIWPLVIFFCSRRRAILICLICVFIAIASRLALFWFSKNLVAAEVLTPCRMDALALGGLLALVARGPCGMRGLVVLAKRVAVVSGTLLIVLFCLSKSLATMSYTLYACFFAALILLAISAAPGSLAGRFWNSRVLRFFGKYSYGWYVFQGLLVPLLLTFFTMEDLAAHLGSLVLGRLVYILWGALTSLALAFLSWHLYEKQFLRLKDVLAKDRR